MNKPSPSLIDAQGMGGIIAQDGFDYQISVALERLPAWLARPTFEHLMLEGFEDIEVRFFAPHAAQQHLLERMQAKSGSLSPAEIEEVFERFQHFDSLHPGITRVHSLITPQLPPTLQWIPRNQRRVRNARPFYAPFPLVMNVTEQSLKDRFVKKFGDVLGRFVYESTEVETMLTVDAQQAAILFINNLGNSFPQTRSVGLGPQMKAHANLITLAGKMRGSPIGREELLRTIGDALGVELAPSTTFKIHVRSDSSEPEATELEIDARAFSARGRASPPPNEWEAKLLVPLIRTATWLRRNRFSRIALGGSFRLSTGVALGRAFRSAKGFELEIPTRDAAWHTDQRPTPSDEPELQINTSTSLRGGRLQVAIGVIRDPTDDLVAAGVDRLELLRVHVPQPILSGQMAQVVVARVKAAVIEAVARLSPIGIDMYLVGPAALAVALGHRWNAMPTTQLHEFDAVTRTYVATALLLE